MFLRRKKSRRLVSAGVAAVVCAVGVGLGLRAERAGGEASEPAGNGASSGPAVAGADEVKLYQLLHDYHFTEPLSTVGQKLRILIWLRYLELSGAQQQLLLNLARKFRGRHETAVREQDEIVRRYEAQLEPLYQQLYEAIAVPAPDEQRIGELARQLEGVNLTHKREDELHTLRVGLVRSILSDEQDFLRTLSPDQEAKLITSLFFLRRQLDPFATPGDYRSIIGPTWNAGDFSSLQKQKGRKESHLNIGGLWGISPETADEAEYLNIQRPIVLFFALKEAALIPALEESLAKGLASAP